MGNSILEMSNLAVMQDDLRHHAQIIPMIEFAAKGGFWTQKALEEFAVQNNIRVCPIAEIIRFPDGKYMVHDGHHRVVATWIAGRHHLRSDEFKIKELTYENYMGINFSVGWVTPFDPRCELRSADIGVYKTHVLDLFAVDEALARNYIQDHKHLYVLPRTVFNVEELALRFMTSLKKTGSLIDVSEYLRQGI